MFLYENDGAMLPPRGVRGTAAPTLRRSHEAYLIYLTPAADGSLRADIDLTPVVGHPITVSYRLDAGPAARGPIEYVDHATVPAEAATGGIVAVTAADGPHLAHQSICPVMGRTLGTAGIPYRVEASGRAVYACSRRCAERVSATPQQYLSRLAAQGVAAPVLR